MNQELQEYPTYVLSADECPPGDDRRHGCGICHRRFNRPSSVLIHMNSHTGAQPFECPFPGCTRRFSVSSNMRHHYRNHRDLGPPDRASALIPTQSPYTMNYRAPEAPRAFYTRSASLFTSSTSSSHTSGSGARSNIASALLDVGSSPLFAPVTLGRSHSDSDACSVRAFEAAPRRLCSCTVEGCDCIEAPTTLRPAVFHTPCVCIRTLICAIVRRVLLVALHTGFRIAVRAETCAWHREHAGSLRVKNASAAVAQCCRCCVFLCCTVPPPPEKTRTTHGEKTNQRRQERSVASAFIVPRMER